MTKKIMSIAAIAAIFTTGANAFDAQSATGRIVLENTANTAIEKYGKFNLTVTPKSAENNISRVATSEKGNALIFPSFFSGKSWSSDFSVINTSNTAVIAKVVLYSAKDTKELRDFNIYLSAHDVFRATIKDGKLTSTDSSCRATGRETVTNNGIHGFPYVDKADMASTEKPFTTDISEDIGYIAVMGMVQAKNTSYGSYETYHKAHNGLWKDYRRLVDNCRGAGWRTTTNNYGGMFIDGGMTTPNIELNTSGFVDGTAACSDIPTTRYAKAKRHVQFGAVDNVLTGSIVLSNDGSSDNFGTRSLLLNATPIQDFTKGNQALLWTEGELAILGDRCITSTASYAKYDSACLANDIAQFNISTAHYEFRDSVASSVLFTQPYKRIILQIDGANATVDADLSKYTNYWSGVKRAKLTGQNSNYAVTNYGGFAFSVPSIYNDDEDMATGSTEGFIVSPAPRVAAAAGIPNEMVMFDPFQGNKPYKSGYTTLNFGANAHGIVTQMSATEVGGNSETNWIYSAVTK